MRFEIVPLSAWDRPVTELRRRSSFFRAEWSATKDLLAREVSHLGGDLVVLQVDVVEGDLRRDGMLRSNAKVSFPGVKVFFDSKFGPLTYATDTYEKQYHQDPPGWQANIRAIALALEALRAVDRYGATRSGEQYRGWTAIPAKSSEFTMSRQDAAKLLAGAPNSPYTADVLLRDASAVDRAYRKLARQHHPDVVGGDPETFRRITAARDVLAAGV